MRFNPRPPLLAGDARAACCRSAAPNVSIRARHCWRAMPATRLARRCDTCFNPRPPLLAGDAQHGRLVQHLRQVSIRARHCWRAMRRVLVSSVTKDRFQSAPAIAGGRCRAGREAEGCDQRFNPRPPLLAGDAGKDAVIAGLHAVSIRARHCWRAMPRRRRHSPSPRTVSIRARHCWRAMPTAPRHRPRCGEVSIRARHCWRAMHPAPRGIRGRREFQSAPAIAGGRCLSGIFFCLQRCGFNPRPPLLAGDARVGKGFLGAVAVSIRARHCWRAMPAPNALRRRSHQFQSAPAIAGGRCPSFRRCTARAPGFNPRPPLLAGDACARRAVPGRQSVSIRARHCWRAMPWKTW